MPRYLAIDYYHQSSRKYHELLLEGMLPVPSYLENSVNYPHLGKIEDESYKCPWKKVNSDLTFLQESEKVKQNLEELALQLGPSIQRSLADNWHCEKDVDLIPGDYSHRLVKDMKMTDLDEMKDFLELDDPRQLSEPFLPEYTYDILKFRANMDAIKRNLTSIPVEDVLHNSKEKAKFQLDLFLSDNPCDDSSLEWTFQKREVCWDNLQFAELSELLPSIRDDLKKYNSASLPICEEIENISSKNREEAKVIEGSTGNVCNKAGGFYDHLKTSDKITLSAIMPVTIQQADDSLEGRLNREVVPSQVSLPSEDPEKIRRDNKNLTSSAMLYSDLTTTMSTPLEASFMSADECSQGSYISDFHLRDTSHEIDILDLKEGMGSERILEKMDEECLLKSYSDSDIDQICLMAYENVNLIISGRKAKPKPHIGNEKATFEENIMSSTGSISSHREKIISVKFKGQYQFAIQLMQRHGNNLIKEVWRFTNGVLDQNMDIINLSSDVTETLLKSMKHELNVIAARNSINCLGAKEFHSRIVALHGLLICKERLLHSDISIAMEYLNSFKKSYSLEVKDFLNPVIRELSSVYNSIQSSQNMHPKLAALIQYVRRKKIQNEEFRILVILKTSLFNNPIVKNLVEMVTGNQIEMFSSNENTKLSEFKPKSNSVTISNLTTAYSLCSPFSTVIEYEPVELSRWKTACRQYHKEYISFEIQISKSLLCSPSRIQVESENEEGGFMVIASRKMTENCDLLYQIECCHNMTMLERNYKKYSRLFGREGLYFADIAIDERTGILVEFIDTSQPRDSAVGELARKVKALSLKYEILWIIITNSDAPQMLGDHVLNKLQSGTLPSDFKLQVVYSCKVEEIARRVFSIVQQTYRKRFIQGLSTGPPKWLNKEANKGSFFFYFSYIPLFLSCCNGIYWSNKLCYL